MTPIAIPSEMLYVSGIAIRQRYAGIDSLKSEKSISVTALIIRKPTNMRAGAVAKPGIDVNTGAIMSERRNRIPVMMDVSPVLPPSATPVELSTNVVVVEVPSIAPAVVATASARSAFFILGSLPFCRAYQLCRQLR